MSKALRNMSKIERLATVDRRTRDGAGKEIRGLGFWAAYDYRVKMSKSKEKKTEE